MESQSASRCRCGSRQPGHSVSMLPIGHGAEAHLGQVAELPPEFYSGFALLSIPVFLRVHTLPHDQGVFSVVILTPTRHMRACYSVVPSPRHRTRCVRDGSVTCKLRDAGGTFLSLHAAMCSDHTACAAAIIDHRLCQQSCPPVLPLQKRKCPCMPFVPSYFMRCCFKLLAPRLGNIRIASLQR